MRTALLTAGLFLAGCASSNPPAMPPVGPWGYEFELGQFTDQRSEDDALMKASQPFTTNSFMVGWRNSVGRSIWPNEPAKLDITLKQYETTTSGSSYELSLDVGLRGRDQYGRTIGQMNARCNAIQRITFGSWWDFGQQANTQGTNAPLTAAGRNATMWQKVMNSCVAELAKQFDTSIAAAKH